MSADVARDHTGVGVVTTAGSTKNHQAERLPLIKILRSNPRRHYHKNQGSNGRKDNRSFHVITLLSILTVAAECEAPVLPHSDGAAHTFIPQRLFGKKF
jgi:hypothetical protein